MTQQTGIAGASVGPKRALVHANSTATEFLVNNYKTENSELCKKILELKSRVAELEAGKIRFQQKTETRMCRYNDKKRRAVRAMIKMQKMLLLCRDVISSFHTRGCSGGDSCLCGSTALVSAINGVLKDNLNESE